jgi:tetratricopeptide (TPR) repeat protein
MSIVVAKSDKRARDEGKETVFFHGETQITRQRIEQFKRRKTWKAVEPVSPGAGEYKGSTAYIWKPAYTKEDTPFNITYHTPSHDIVDDPAELSAIEEDAILRVPTIIAPPPSPSPYQLLEGATFSQLHDERIFELANVIEPEFENAPPGPGRLGDTPNSAYGPFIVHDLACNIIDGDPSETCQPFTPLSTTQLDAHSHELLEKQHQDSPMHNLSVNEIFDSLSTGPPASKYPETPGTGISPTSGGLADQLPIIFTDSEDGDSHEETYSESSSIWSDEEIDVLSGLEITSECFPVSVDFSTSKVETAVLEALALNSNDNIINLEFSQIAKLPVFDGVAINYSRLYKPLNVLSNRYLKRGLLDQAGMAVRLMELVHAEVFRDFTISPRCNFQKARILRKQNDYEGSKACISRAIAIYKQIGDKEQVLKCQLFLGDTLLSRGRCSEALHVSVEALIEQRGTWQGSGKVMALIRKLHLKMNESDRMEEVIFTSSILGDLLDERGAMVYSRTFDILTEFAQLGAGYSKLGLFGVADLCFELPEPVWDGLPPTVSYYIQQSQFRKEYSLHSLRQDKILQALTQLTLAFECIQSLATDLLFWPFVLLGETSPQDSHNALRQVFEELSKVLSEATFHKPALLAEIRCYEKVNSLANKISFDFSLKISSPLTLYDTDFRKHEKRTNKIGKDKIRAPSIRSRAAASISSNGSSMFSMNSSSSRFGLTYSVGSASSYVSNSAFMVDSDRSTSPLDPERRVTRGKNRDVGLGEISES